MIFIESKVFTRNLQRSAGATADSVLRSIQNDLLVNPLRGDIVQGLGGMRKARTADPARNKGKRGGYRYLFVYVEKAQQIHLLHLFGKDQQDDLSDEERGLLRILVGQLKRGR